MSIQPTNEEFIIRLLADYTADTLAELDADLATYVGKYVHVLEDDKIYYIDNPGGTPTRCEAAESSNYVTSPADLATETTLAKIANALVQGPLDQSNSSQTPLANTEIFAGEYNELCKQATLFVFAFSDQPLTTFEVQWSPDGINPRTGLLATTDVLTTETFTSGFYVYLDVITTNIDNWYKVIAENASGTDQTILEIDTWVYSDGFPGTYLGLSDDLSNLSVALLGRSVLAGNIADEDLNETETFGNVLLTPENALTVGNPWRNLIEDSFEVSGSLPSGTLPAFDKVGPIVAPNVIDSGWINGTRFKDQLGHFQFDIPGVKVFLMNASDDQGNNSATTNFFSPTATSEELFPGFVKPIVSGAPFFQKWFRIVVVNDSGTECTGYSIRSQGSDTPVGPVYQSIDQPIFDFFPAPITQNIIKGKKPDGAYESVELDREGNLNTAIGGFRNPEVRGSILSVPQTPFKTVPVETIQDFVRIRWDTDTIDDVVDTTESTGSSVVERDGNHGVFRTGTTAGSLTVARTYDLIEYDPAHGVVIDFTEQVKQDSEDPDSYYYMGQGDSQDAVGVGRGPDSMNAGREFGILFRSRGVDAFIPQSLWNGDKCDGGVDSNFRKDGAPIPIRDELTGQMNGRVFSIVYGYLGYASISIFVKSPDDGYVLAHVIAYDDEDTHLGNTVLPMFAEAYNGSSTDEIIIRSGSWRGGIYKSREESKVSSQNSFNEVRTAGSEFVGLATSTKGFDQIDVSILADQPSAIGGMKFQGRSTGGRWYNIAPVFTHNGTNESRLSDDGLFGVRTFQLPKGAEFFRVKYKQGAVDGTVELTTILQPRLSLTSVHRVEETLSGDRSTSVVKSVLAGAITGTNTYRNVDVDDKGRLQTINGSIFARLRAGQVEDDERLKLDLAPGATYHYIGVAPRIAGTGDVAWYVIRIAYDISQKPEDIQFSGVQIAWSDRTNAAHWATV